MKNQMLKRVNNFGVTWDNETEHERKAKWLRELRAEKDNFKQNDINITTEVINEKFNLGLLAQEITNIAWTYSKANGSYHK